MLFVNNQVLDVIAVIISCYDWRCCCVILSYIKAKAKTFLRLEKSSEHFLVNDASGRQNAAHANLSSARHVEPLQDFWSNCWISLVLEADLEMILCSWPWKKFWPWSWNFFIYFGLGLGHEVLDNNTGVIMSAVVVVPASSNCAHQSSAMSTERWRTYCKCHCLHRLFILEVFNCIILVFYSKLLCANLTQIVL